MKEFLEELNEQQKVTQKEWCLITVVAFLLGIVIGVAFAPAKKGIRFNMNVLSNNKGNGSDNANGIASKSYQCDSEKSCDK